MPEERHQPVTDSGVEAFRSKSDLVGRGAGDVAAAPARSLSGQKLVQGDCGGVAIGRVVPASALGKEGIAIRRRSQADLVRVGGGEGKVEEKEMSLSLLVGRQNAEVSRLDIAMLDTAFFQFLQGEQQILAPAFGVVDALRSLVRQQTRQGLSGVGQAKAGSSAELHDLV